MYICTTLVHLSRYELVLYFKFNRLYIISENISHLLVFSYRLGPAILCEVYYKDKSEDNIFVYSYI